MSKYNLFVEQALSGEVADLKDTFDYLVRESIESKIEGMRPEIHASIFGSKTVESFAEGVEKYHIKFKDKSNGQWFKSRSFKSQNEMNQHFWQKIKPVAGEVQFHGPKGRIAEETNIMEASEADLTAMLPVVEGSTTEVDNAPKLDSEKFGKFNRSPIVEAKVGPWKYDHSLNESFADMSHEAHELVLHADNTQHLHHAQHAYVKNMQGHMKKGKYDSEKGKKLWGYYADHVAKDYHKEHGDRHTPWHKVFTKQHRNEVAAHFEQQHRDEAHHNLKEDVTLSEGYHTGNVLSESFHDMSHAARELVLHSDNTHHLYQSQHGYVNNMKRHMARGSYDSTKGKKLWGYHADEVAKDYHKTYGDKHTPWHKAFTKKDRDQVAAHFEEHHRAELKHEGVH
jgi:alkylated DNA nucleotide flippase Atl1